MDEFKKFSEHDLIEYGVLVFSIHNITLDALLWNELHKNLMENFEDLKFYKKLPNSVDEEQISHDNVIYIEYNAKYTSIDLFNQYIEYAIHNTFYNCSLAPTDYDSKTKIDITICVHGEILNFTINFKRGDIPWKLPVDNPEYLKF